MNKSTPSGYNFSAQLKLYQQRNNDFLAAELNLLPDLGNLKSAMLYATLLGGKRIRPFLVYSIGEMLGAKIEDLDYVAAAVESIHAYSLIHDDLPAMDDDDLRRGKATCHIKFDQATAILAGDALQSFAFELLTKSTLDSKQVVMLIRCLADAIGANGMCLGQNLDLQASAENMTLNALEQIHNYKTGCLIVAASKMALYSSPQFNDPALCQKITQYAQAIGLAFQVQDDILDVIGNTEITGKTVGIDSQNNKLTYPGLLGLAGAQQKTEQLYHSALQILDDIPFNTQALAELARFIVVRQK